MRRGTRRPAAGLGAGDRRLYVRGYPAELSNNRMSLDIAVGLAHLTGRTLVPFDFELRRRSDGGRAPRTRSLMDLFDIPVPWTPDHLYDRAIRRPAARVCDWAPVPDAVFVYPTIPEPADLAFPSFRNGRTHVNTFSDKEDEASELVIDTVTLGHYSYFFYLDPPRRTALLRTMKKIRPKLAYRQLAERVVAELGSFNAVHLRRTDFVRHHFTPRSSTVTGDEAAGVLAEVLDVSKPLVVCTDQSDDTEFFGPIQRRFDDLIFLDGHLNCAHGQELASLPFADDAVIGMLTQLVAAGADRFVGTLYSTFTGIIHRLRGFAGKADAFRYCYNDFDSPLVRFENGEFTEIASGPFSWNRAHYPVFPGQLSWVREWPEAFRLDDQTSPGGAASILLLADGATIRGTSARLEPRSEPCIGWWYDANDTVEWNFDTPEGQFAVEIRYACPPSDAGSIFEVIIADDVVLNGVVDATGSWIIPSPWLRVGDVTLPAGPHRLVVRIPSLAAEAGMNLYGLRLVPVGTSC